MLKNCLSSPPCSVQPRSGATLMKSETEQPRTDSADKSDQVRLFKLLCIPMWSLLLFKVGCSALVLAVSIVRTPHAFLLLSSEGGSAFSALRSHIIYVSPHVCSLCGCRIFTRNERKHRMFCSQLFARRVKYLRSPLSPSPA